jgi:branched-chain amino acid transport system permease protein
LGGLFLGFVEAFGHSLIGTGTDIIAFVMVIVVLLVRPGGLLGREWVLE